MTTGIVTLYNYFNFGAVLQALAMQKAVETLGHEAEFLNLNTPKFSYKRYRMLAYRMFATSDPKKIMFNMQRVRSYKEMFDLLKVDTQPYARLRKRYDAVVIGSDELWNVTNPAFHCAPQFFGNDLDSNRIVSYAPSCGQATYDDVAKFPGAREGLLKLSSISGRDESTIGIVERLTSRKPTKVLDPTFIYDLRSYEEPFDERHYILVYTYGFKRDEVEKTREFARRSGKKLLSAGFYQEWCDRSLPISPMQFLGMIRNADHIVTNTFHGSVFSIIYGKSLAVFAAGKLKILDLLGELGLLGRDVSSVGALSDVLTQEIDTARVNEILARRREQSLDFLRQALSTS